MAASVSFLRVVIAEAEAHRTLLHRAEVRVHTRRAVSPPAARLNARSLPVRLRYMDSCSDVEATVSNSKIAVDVRPSSCTLIEPAGQREFVAADCVHAVSRMNSTAAADPRCRDRWCVPASSLVGYYAAAAIWNVCTPVPPTHTTGGCPRPPRRKGHPCPANHEALVARKAQ